jgi:hypothetical protein
MSPAYALLPLAWIAVFAALRHVAAIEAAKQFRLRSVWQATFVAWTRVTTPRGRRFRNLAFAWMLAPFVAVMLFVVVRDVLG